MINDTDFDALCAAIDAGDDTALPVLADLLEERGDSRAAGLRLVGDRRPYQPWKGHFGWAEARTLHRKWKHGLPTPVWDRMRSYRDRWHPNRSAAFLALAEALTPCDKRN